MREMDCERMDLRILMDQNLDVTVKTRERDEEEGGEIRVESVMC